MSTTSNIVTVTVAGITYTYTLTLTASPTSLSDAGGTITLNAAYSSNPSGANLYNISVVFTELTTNTTVTSSTNTSGVATATFTLPADNTTTAQSYQFQATGAL